MDQLDPLEPVARSFFGATSREALQAVRAALGDDAAILETREVDTPRGRRFEVRAAAPSALLELPADPPRPTTSSPTSSPLLPPLEPGVLGRDHDLPAVVGRRIAERVRRLQASGLNHEAATIRAFDEVVATIAPPWDPCGGRRVMAFVGPTGAGKTTTIAKVAAQGILRRLKVALITTDTWRVGAIQHMARYGELMGVPTYVAGRDEELVTALAHTRGADLVLIDTAGRSPTDDAVRRDLQRLRTFGREHLVEVLAVVPAATSERQLRLLRQRYTHAAPAGVIVTKVDECEGWGGVVGCAALLGLPIAAVATGQRVPDDVVAPSVDDLRARVGGAW